MFRKRRKSSLIDATLKESADLRAKALDQPANRELSTKAHLLSNKLRELATASVDAGNLKEFSILTRELDSLNAIRKTLQKAGSEDKPSDETNWLLVGSGAAPDGSPRGEAHDRLQPPSHESSRGGYADQRGDRQGNGQEEGSDRVMSQIFRNEGGTEVNSTGDISAGQLQNPHIALTRHEGNRTQWSFPPLADPLERSFGGQRARLGVSNNPGDSKCGIMDSENLSGEPLRNQSARPESLDRLGIGELRHEFQRNSRFENLRTDLATCMMSTPAALVRSPLQADRPQRPAHTFASPIRPGDGSNVNDREASSKAGKCAGSKAADGDLELKQLQIEVRAAAEAAVRAESRTKSLEMEMRDRRIEATDFRTFQDEVQKLRELVEVLSTETRRQRELAEIKADNRRDFDSSSRPDVDSGYRPDLEGRTDIDISRRPDFEMMKELWQTESRRATQLTRELQEAHRELFEKQKVVRELQARNLELLDRIGQLECFAKLNHPANSFPTLTAEPITFKARPAEHSGDFTSHEGQKDIVPRLRTPQSQAIASLRQYPNGVTGSQDFHESPRRNVHSAAIGSPVFSRVSRSMSFPGDETLFAEDAPYSDNIVKIQTQYDRQEHEMKGLIKISVQNISEWQLDCVKLDYQIAPLADARQACLHVLISQGIANDAKRSRSDLEKRSLSIWRRADNLSGVRRPSFDCARKDGDVVRSATCPLECWEVQSAPHLMKKQAGFTSILAYKSPENQVYDSYILLNFTCLLPDAHKHTVKVALLGSSIIPWFKPNLATLPTIEDLKANYWFHNEFVVLSMPGSLSDLCATIKKMIPSHLRLSKAGHPLLCSSLGDDKFVVELVEGEGSSRVEVSGSNSTAVKVLKAVLLSLS